MDIVPIYKRVIGLDVHQAQITACAITEPSDGSVAYELREFGGFKRDRKALAEWARSVAPDVVVMESTGIYWKSPYAALEAVGISAWVVNARHVKAVPGRKTDVLDAQWLASLARAGLLRASFIAKADLRSLRHIARQRQKLGGMLASEKNRLHKLLTDAGVRLGVVVSDLHGQSARAMIKALIAGKSTPEVLNLASKRLRASRQDIFEALQAEEITPAHRFVLTEIMAHIEELESRIARFDAQLLRSLQDAGYGVPLQLLQTLPGIDLMGAAMLLVEIGADMSVFGSAQRLASWAGMCPGNNESAGKRKSGRIKKGNAWVRRLLCEFAQAAGRSRCALKDKFQALSVRKGQQTLHRSAGAQDAAYDLRHAQQKHPLRGQDGGLRGADGGTQCAKVATDVGQARLRACTGLSR